MNDQPAFPQSNDRVVHALSVANSSGMTLRDYFAARAMQAYSSHALPDEPWAMETLKSRAKLAYIQADAMMEARNGQA
jgi:hypothetical protein